MHEITATFGHSTTVNHELAKVIRAQCVKTMGETRGLFFFGLLFSAEEVFAIKPQAAALVQKPWKKAPRNLRKLYRDALLIEPKTPALKVERAKAEAEHA
jgi:hypothetical protein